MHPLAKVLLHFLKLGLHSLPHRGTLHLKSARLGHLTLVSKPEERKCFWLAFTPLGPLLSSASTEFDQTRFLRVYCKSELRQAFLKLRQKALRIRLLLKTHYEVIRVSDKDHISARDLTSPSLDPQVEDVM